MARGKCSPEQREHCPLMQHFSDEHHLFFPKRDYQTRVERDFRELPENKAQLCRYEHNQIHATGVIPEKPSRGDMIQAIAQSVIELSA